MRVCVREMRILSTPELGIVTSTRPRSGRASGRGSGCSAAYNYGLDWSKPRQSAAYIYAFVRSKSRQSAAYKNTFVRSKPRQSAATKIITSGRKQNRRETGPEVAKETKPP